MACKGGCCKTCRVTSDKGGEECVRLAEGPRQSTCHCLFGFVTGSFLALSLSLSPPLSLSSSTLSHTCTRCKINGTLPYRPVRPGGSGRARATGARVIKERHAEVCFPPVNPRRGSLLYIGRGGVPRWGGGVPRWGGAVGHTSPHTGVSESVSSRLLKLSHRCVWRAGVAPGYRHTMEIKNGC